MNICGHILHISIYVIFIFLYLYIYSYMKNFLPNQDLVARRISIKANAKGNRKDILRHLPVPAHLFVTLMSLNRIESLADARKSGISREPLRAMTTATLFLLVLFLARPARKSLREAAKPPSKRMLNTAIFPTTVLLIAYFSQSRRHLSNTSH